jgi:hypothetical protein
MRKAKEEFVARSLNTEMSMKPEMYSNLNQTLGSTAPFAGMPLPFCSYLLLGYPSLMPALPQYVLDEDNHGTVATALVAIVCGRENCQQLTSQAPSSLSFLPWPILHVL